MIRFAPVLLLLLAACVAREVKPTEQEMDRVEAALEKLPCIGRIDDWERRYLYHPQYFGEEVAGAMKEGREPRPSGYDRSQIEIHLHEANFEEFGEGRTSLSNYPSDLLATDDREYRLPYGSFDLITGKLHMAACGANS